MLVKNISSKIIGVQEISILPGETAELPKGYENNPVVQKYIKNETFLVVKKKSKVVQDPDKDKGAGIQSLDDQAGGGVTDNQDDLTKGKDQKE